MAVYNLRCAARSDINSGSLKAEKRLSQLSGIATLVFVRGHLNITRKWEIYHVSELSLVDLLPE